MKPSVSSKEVSIFIPTMNRSDFLIRALRYFCENNFKGPICVGDSSDLEHIEKVKKELVSLKGRVNVVYGEYPGQTGAQAIFNLVAQISTPYAVYIGDDDFLVPDALIKCASFLEQSPAFSACCGKAISISQKNEHSELVMSSGSYGDYRDLLEETASERFLNFMNRPFVTVFALQRTEQMKKAYGGVDTLAELTFTELIPCCCSVLQGKIKIIDCLFLVRQCHEYHYRQANVYDWLTNENWFPSYQQFAHRLASMLSEKDSIPIEQAHEVVKKGFWKYLANVLFKKWEGRYDANNGNFKERLKMGVKKIPLATQFWRTLYSYTPGGKMTLPSLLRKSSPYHTHFLPVYQAIQNIKK